MALLVKSYLIVVIIHSCGICRQISGFILSRPSTMTLENNEYKNVVIAIHDSVPEDTSLIDTLKDTMTKASKYLYTATRHRAFFKEIKILLPSSWSKGALYAVPTSENLAFADVIITDPIRGKRSLPQARSYDGCGKQGVHVLLTKEFLTLPRLEPYFNDPAKYFIHAFAQFRWGVFQEYAEEGEPGFYISPTTGRPEPIKCTIMLRGLVQKNDSAHTICYLPSQAQSNNVVASVDNKTGLYESDCLWRPYPTRQRTRASLMDHQYIRELETFCDDNTTNYMTAHNFEAPSKHNRLCGHRSTWEIITKTDDFSNDRNPPRGLLDAQVEPTFIVMRAPSRKRRAAIMIDYAVAKKHSVQRAIGRLKHEASIHDIEMRIFDNSKDKMAHAALSSVENVNKVIGQAAGQTVKNDIAKRINDATKIFKKEGKVNDTHLIIITNKRPDDVTAMLNSSKEKGLKTSAISLYDDTDFAEYPDCHMIGMRHGHTFLDRLRQVVSEDIHGALIVARDEILLLKTNPASGYVDVDQTLTKHLAFIFHFENELPYIDVRSPSDVIYNIEDDVCAVDYDFRAIKFHFAFTETGRWTYTIRQSSWRSQKVELTVMSEDINRNFDTILIRPSVKLVDEGPTHLLLHVDVTQGSTQLIGLNVAARIENPVGKVTSLHLLDNGAGADVSKNDGIYTRVHITPPLNGSYHVTFKVTGDRENALRKEDAFAFTYDDDTQVKKVTSKAQVDYNFQRVVPGGSINIQHASTMSSTDTIAPSRITDLEAVRHIPYRNSIALKWTAPGDDFDHGKATAYQLFVGYDVKDIRSFLQYTETGRYDGEGHVTREKVVAKTSATYAELFLWDVKMLAKSYIFAIYAIDEYGNMGNISNVAIAPVILKTT